MTNPVDELDGTVAVMVAGEEVRVSRPPFRRLRNLLPMVMKMTDGMDSDGNASEGDVPMDVLVDVGEEIARVLFGDDANSVLDRLYTPAEFGAFVMTSVNALQLGEAEASTDS